MKEPVTRRFRAPPLLAKCLIASLTLHSFALYFFIKHPISIMRSENSLFLKTKPIPSLVSGEDSWETDNLALEHFFEEFAITSKTDLLRPVNPDLNQKPVFLLQEKEQDISLSWPSWNILDDAQEDNAKLIPPSFTFKIPDSLPLENQDFVFTAPSSISKQKPDLHPLLDSLALSSEEPLIEDRILSEKDLPPTMFFPLKEPLASKNQEPLLSCRDDLFLEDKKQPITPLKPLSLSSEQKENFLNLEKETPVAFKNKKNIHSLISKGSLATIEDYLPSQSILSLKWSNDFTVVPTFFPDEDGYVFSLTVTPNQALETQRIKQNIYFLIDVSSDIEKHKIGVFKKSVLKALASLQSGDSFNIFLLDKTIVKLSPQSIPFSFKNLQLAEEFLEKKQEKALFSSFDLFKGLSETLDSIKEDDEVHTAVLLTNGKLTSNFTTQQKALQSLLEKNSEKISLFAAAVGQNNNLVNLDMLSSLFGGKLLYSDTNASFPRKLGAFVKNMQSPLAKNISISIEPSDSKADLTIFPSSFQIPNLYSKEPFIIMGRVDRLCSLQMTLEGKNEESLVLLNKEINFEDAIESSNALKKEWSIRQTSSLYEKFLKDSKSEHLKEAKEILKTAYGRTFGE